MPDDGAVATFASAARSFAALVRDVPDEVLGDATVLAARIATAIGEGQTVLLSLTGRTALPPSFCVV